MFAFVLPMLLAVGCDSDSDGDGGTGDSEISSQVSGLKHRALDCVDYNHLISHVSPDAVPGDHGFTQRPDVSANGDVIVYGSMGQMTSNIPDMYNRKMAFAYIRSTGETVLVSANEAGDPPDAASSPEIDQLAVSGNGRVASFVDRSNAYLFDDAGNPIDEDTSRDVYVRDLQTQTTRLVSRSSGLDGAQDPGTGVAGGLLDYEGDRVAFTTISKFHLASPIDRFASEQIFVRDLDTHQTRLAVTDRGGEMLDGGGRELQFAANGRYLLFTTPSTNMDDHADATGTAVGGLFVVDLDGNEGTRRVAFDLAGNAMNVQNGQISASGNRVVYRSGNDIYVHELDTGVLRIDTNVTCLSGSCQLELNQHYLEDGSIGDGDGQYLLVSDSAADRDLYLYDLDRGLFAAVSRMANGDPVNVEGLVSLSGDASTAAYVTRDVVDAGADTGGTTPDVYIREFFRDWGPGPSYENGEIVSYYHDIADPDDGANGIVVHEPPLGTPWLAGDVYRNICCTHDAHDGWAPPIAFTVWERIRECGALQPPVTWEVGAAYEVDEEVEYAGTRYKCRVAHTSQSDWTPPVTPALWEALP